MKTATGVTHSRTHSHKADNWQNFLQRCKPFRKIYVKRKLTQILALTFCYKNHACLYSSELHNTINSRSWGGGGEACFNRSCRAYVVHARVRGHIPKLVITIGTRESKNHVHNPHHRACADNPTCYSVVFFCVTPTFFFLTFSVCLTTSSSSRAL